MELVYYCAAKPLKVFTITTISSQYRQNSTIRNQAYIDGKWVAAKNSAVYPVCNPATDKLITQVPDMQGEDVRDAINAAFRAFKTWQRVTAKDRSRLLMKWNDVCAANGEKLADLMTAESGKPLSESKAEVAYGCSFLEWFAGCPRHLNGMTIPSPWPNKQIMTVRQPLGVVSVITPWNFPFSMVTRKVGALLAAGCTCVIKPAEDTPLTAIYAVELAEKAGIPKGVINIITCSRKNAAINGSIMCEDPRIHCISFTGSTIVGKILYKQAAKGMKRVCLELGGNAPFIVFPSANMERAVLHAMIAKFRNTGQSCVGANRFLIHKDSHDQFIKCFAQLISTKLKMGNGIDKDVNCGPLINAPQAQKVSRLVEDAVKKGARLLVGGKIDTKLGNKFFQPTLLIDVKSNMDIYHEEVFGPVAAVSKISSEQEALEIANSTKSGMASYVFTRDYAQALRMSQNLDFAMVAINDGLLSTPEPPFGGFKQSGIGREGSMQGVYEYCELKYTLLSALEE